MLPGRLPCRTLRSLHVPFLIAKCYQAKQIKKIVQPFFWPVDRLVGERRVNVLNLLQKDLERRTYNGVENEKKKTKETALKTLYMNGNIKME